MKGQSPSEGDALVIVDVQNDFLPGGTLAVPDGNDVVPPLNVAIRAFGEAGLPIFATRDWHPSDHCSFIDRGGIWPPHCVAETEGAAFARDLSLPESAVVVSKAVRPDRDAYSGFAGTDLSERLSNQEVTRIFLGGLATDYCVLNTVLDALKEGFDVIVLDDAVRAVDVEFGDGARAIERMRDAGAVFAPTGALFAPAAAVFVPTDAGFREA